MSAPLPPRCQAAPLLAGLLLLCSLHGAAALPGEGFLGDLKPATQSPMNQGAFADVSAGGRAAPRAVRAGAAARLPRQAPAQRQRLPWAPTWPAGKGHRHRQLH